MNNYYAMLETRKYNRNRIILFVLFSLVTIVIYLVSWSVIQLRVIDSN